MGGLRCLWKAGYIHGDLKADNVLYEGVDPEQCPSGVRLTDFGLSRERGLPMVTYSTDFYEEATHLPEFLFTHEESEVEATSKIDICSLKTLMVEDIGWAE